MPWKNTTTIGERWALVQTLFHKETSVTRCSQHFGVSRKTAYKWLKRFVAGGQRDLADRSRRPRHVPLQVRPHWIERIAQARRRHPYWGPKKIQVVLLQHYGQAPATSTIARWLERLQLVHRRRRRPRKACWLRLPPLTQATAPNQVWTADFKGWFRTGNGQRVEPLTVRDLFSRYVLAVQLLSHQQWRPTQAVFRRLFRQYGLPQVIRTDNGGPFASTGPAGLTRLSAWWTTLGIRVEFTRPGHPEDNGAHEQMHRVMKLETTRPAATTRQGQQHRTTLWVKQYNGSRPHEALGQQVPLNWYGPQRGTGLLAKHALNYPATWPQRQVRSNGQIRWQGRKRFVGEAFVGQRLGLKPMQPGVQAVYFHQILIGHLHDQDPGAMRPAVYHHSYSHRKK